MCCVVCVRTVYWCDLVEHGAEYLHTWGVTLPRPISKGGSSGGGPNQQLSFCYCWLFYDTYIQPIPSPPLPSPPLSAPPSPPSPLLRSLPSPPLPLHCHADVPGIQDQEHLLPSGHKKKDRSLQLSPLEPSEEACVRGEGDTVRW